MQSGVDLFRSRVREILLTDWDPSNASRNEAAVGAYDGYLSPICDLIRSDAGEEAIVDFLYEREREIMCFPGLGKQRLRRVAQRLILLRAKMQ
jgi:hypothetical protein